MIGWLVVKRSNHELVSFLPKLQKRLCRGQLCNSSMNQYVFKEMFVQFGEKGFIFVSRLDKNIDADLTFLFSVAIQ